MKFARFLTTLALLFAPLAMGAVDIESMKISPSSGLLGIGAVISISVVAPTNDIFPADCFMNGVFATGYKDDNAIKYTYVIRETDSPFEDGNMAISCAVQNEAGDVRSIFKSDLNDFSVSIDNARVRVTRAAVTPSSGTVSDGDRVRLSFDMNKNTLTSSSCIVNNAENIEIKQKDSESFTYEGVYTVEKTHDAWKAGKLPLKCVFQDPAKNKLRVEVFNDFNSLAGAPSEADNSDASESGSQNGSDASGSNSGNSEDPSGSNSQGGSDDSNSAVSTALSGYMALLVILVAFLMM